MNEVLGAMVTWSWQQPLPCRFESSVSRVKSPQYNPGDERVWKHVIDIQQVSSRYPRAWAVVPAMTHTAPETSLSHASAKSLKRAANHIGSSAYVRARISTNDGMCGC
jgi:hypothetical protein